MRARSVGGPDPKRAGVGGGLEEVQPLEMRADNFAVASSSSSPNHSLLRDFKNERQRALIRSSPHTTGETRIMRNNGARGCEEQFRLLQSRRLRFNSTWALSLRNPAWCMQDAQDDPAIPRGFDGIYVRTGRRHLVRRSAGE